MSTLYVKIAFTLSNTHPWLH